MATVYIVVPAYLHMHVAYVRFRTYNNRCISVYVNIDRARCTRDSGAEYPSGVAYASDIHSLPFSFPLSPSSFLGRWFTVYVVRRLNSHCRLAAKTKIVACPSDSVTRKSLARNFRDEKYAPL